MPWVESELTIPGSERAKSVHELDSSATVTGNTTTTKPKLKLNKLQNNLLRIKVLWLWQILLLLFSYLLLSTKGNPKQFQPP
jgi:hypothetical protein